MMRRERGNGTCSAVGKPYGGRTAFGAAWQRPIASLSRTRYLSRVNTATNRKELRAIPRCNDDAQLAVLPDGTFTCERAQLSSSCWVD